MPLFEMVHLSHNHRQSITFNSYRHTYWTFKALASLKIKMITHNSITRWERLQVGIHVQGGPERIATLTINNFKKTRDRMKKLCTLLRIKFFSQQDDTKIVNFDEGVLILWSFFWGNVIFKICPSISKVTIYVPKIYHCLASPGKVSALAL